MKPGEAVSLIEAAYRIDLPTERWLGEIASTAAKTFNSDRALVFRYDASSGERIVSDQPALHGLFHEFARDLFDQDDAPAEATKGVTLVFQSVRFGSLREVIERFQIVPFGQILDRHDIDDIVGINGVDPSGRGCMLAIADRRRKHSARTVHLWTRLAAHISAGNRLRAAVDALSSRGSDSTTRAEAILAPSGKVEHATGPAESRAAREALRNALVRIDTARSERLDARRSVELWRGLVAGRWSLVEHFERDGKRYFLAHKNDPELAPDRALTEREQQVLGYAGLGHSNKLIGYELGLSTSTVSTLLGRARGKLGTRDRFEP